MLYCLVIMSAGQNVFNENETIAKYEIMDGAPVRGMYRSMRCIYSSVLHVISDVTVLVSVILTALIQEQIIQ